MVQSVLFFALGFLCAAFLTVLVAPAVWRRAIALTRRRIEGVMPLKISEIQAEKDAIRAEFAMASRKLEMEIKALKEKAAMQMVEINRGQEGAKELAVERDARSRELAEMQAAADGLRMELSQREEQIGRLSEQLAAGEKALEARAGELERLGQMYDEASFSSSNRQIELVARESELDKLAGDISTLRAQRKEADRRTQEAQAESRAARDALEAEKKRADNLDRKLERMLATLADHQETLDRRERELDRLRERQKDNSDLEAPRLAASDDGGDARLREEIRNLAAEVINLAVKLDGPDSQIAQALDQPSKTVPPAGHAPSLADKVRTLRKAGSRV